MKKERKTIGYVYKAQNKVTGKVYIGATTDSIENRKKDHQKKANNSQGNEFHEAVHK